MKAGEAIAVVAKFLREEPVTTIKGMGFNMMFWSLVLMGVIHLYKGISK